MTRSRGPGDAGRQVIIIGSSAAGHAAAAELAAAGVTDVLILDDASGAGEVVSSVFDDNSDSWAVHTAAGEVFRSRVVIMSHRATHVPWVPDFPGRDDFRGASFHAARWDPDLDPNGKRIAVIGADANAGHHIGRLMESAAAVTVFAHPPRRIVPELPLPMTRAARWVRRRIGLGPSRPTPALVGSPISAITATGIRTRDGSDYRDHRADAIVYGTGFTIADQVLATTLVGAGGLTIRQAWDDGMEPYFGVAVHGFPNHFFITGPDIEAQARYVAGCLRLMQRTGSTRVEVRRSSHQVFNERVYVQPAQPHPAVGAFDLSSDGAADDEIYDGAATLTIAGVDHPVRVRLTGRLDPIDGRYHWQGTVFSRLSQPLPEEAAKEARTATLTVGERSAPARIIEQTPWGTHSVAGVGAPPYALRPLRVFGFS